MDCERLIRHLNKDEQKFSKSLLEIRGLPVSFLDDPQSVPDDQLRACLDTVLDACSLLNKKPDTTVSALHDLSQLYVLFWKGRYAEAGERLNELKTEFEQREEFSLLQLLNQLEIYLCSVDWETAEFEQRMDQLIKNYVITTHKAIDLLSRWSLDTKLNRHLIQRGPSKNIMDTYDYDHLKEEVFVQKNKHAMSTYAQYYQLRSEKHLYELDGNDRQLYFTNVQIVSLMEGHPKQFGSSISNMVYAYYHLGKTALMNNMEEEALRTVEKIRSLEGSGDIAIYDRDNFSLSLEIDINLYNRDFKKVLSYEGQAEQLFSHTSYSNEMVKEEHRKFYDYQFALAEFWEENYSAALKHLKQITAHPERARMFKDLLASAYRLELLILGVTSRWQDLEQLIDKATRFLEQAQLFNQLEASQVQTLRRISKTQGQQMGLDLSRWRN
jgi:hypothetical protein